ncbi:MAG: hypothetical protein SGJ17_00470 [Hyphomicrobiales bacterium]|nr:hypothetical protein [Hyphomicrobiales bacterium]
MRYLLLVILILQPTQALSAHCYKIIRKTPVYGYNSRHVPTRRPYAQCIFLRKGSEIYVKRSTDKMLFLTYHTKAMYELPYYRSLFVYADDVTPCRQIDATVAPSKPQIEHTPISPIKSDFAPPEIPTDGTVIKCDDLGRIENSDKRFVCLKAQKDVKHFDAFGKPYDGPITKGNCILAFKATWENTRSVIKFFRGSPAKLFEADKKEDNKDNFKLCFTEDYFQR